MGFDVMARSFEDAQRRMWAIQYGTVNGSLVKALVWLRNHLLSLFGRGRT